MNCGFIRLQQKMGLAVAKESGQSPSEEEIHEFSQTLSLTRMIQGEQVEKSAREL